MDVDVDADGEAEVEEDEDAEGEMDVEGEMANVEDSSSVKISSDILLSGQGNLAASSTLPLVPTESSHPLLDPHLLTLLRAPVFALGSHETVIDASTLDYSPDERSPISMELLFPELPIYSIAAPDPAHDKRIEEASAFSGRISNVSKHFDSRPLLVSTLQPSKTRSSAGWNAAMSYNLEDVKEVGDNHELLPVASSELPRLLHPMRVY